jgi:KRAB domain-containing zinc finger protein
MKTHTCPRCNKEFSRKSNLDFHLNRKFKCLDIIPSNDEDHPSNDEDPKNKFECECGLQFSWKTNLIRHQKTRCGSSHVPEKLFECSECGKQCSRKDNMVRHQQLCLQRAEAITKKVTLLTIPLTSSRKLVSSVLMCT